MGKLENSQEHDHKELDEIYKGVITNGLFGSLEKEESRGE